MIIQFGQKKLSTAFYNKSAIELYTLFLEARGKKIVCDASIAYLKAFVHFHPRECIRIIRSIDNTHFTTYPYGLEYLHLLTLISAYHLDRKEFVFGLTWAMKAIHMVTYFFPTLTKEQARLVEDEFSASEFVCSFPQYRGFNYIFSLDWENERDNSYILKLQANDNSRVRHF